MDKVVTISYLIELYFPLKYRECSKLSFIHILENKNDFSIPLKLSLLLNRSKQVYFAGNTGKTCLFNYYTPLHSFSMNVNRRTIAYFLVLFVQQPPSNSGLSSCIYEMIIIVRSVSVRLEMTGLNPNFVRIRCSGFSFITKGDLYSESSNTVRFLTAFLEQASPQFTFFGL